MSSIARSTDRLNNFSDGVFGVAATMLIVPVFNLIVDQKSGKKDLLELIQGDFPRALFIWLISVAVVGTFWIAHHNILHLVKKWDRWLLWINTAFLLSVTFLPVPLAILAHYWVDDGVVKAVRDRAIGVTVYGFAVIVCSFGLFAIWRYMARHGELLWDDVNPALFKPVEQQILTGPRVYVVAIVLAWVPVAVEPVTWVPAVVDALAWLSVVPSLLIFGGVQVWYMLPGNIDRDAKLRSVAPAASPGE